MREELGLNNYTLLTIVMVVLISGTLVEAIPYPMAKKGCQERCGNISIPYPFGIGKGCFYGNNFGYPYNFYSVTCNYSYNPPKLIYGIDIKVLNISLDGEFRTLQEAAYVCYNDVGRVEMGSSRYSSGVHMLRFTLSSTKNHLIGVGCDTYAWFKGRRSEKAWIKSPLNETRPFYSGCMTFCSAKGDVSESNGACSSLGCCKASIPPGVTNISSTVGSFYNHTNVNKFNPCSAAFVAAIDHTFSYDAKLISEDGSYYSNLALPVVYDWAIGTDNCAVAKHRGMSAYICKGNSECLNMPLAQGGYRCQCLSGYRGNPYLEDCQDINECEDDNPCEKEAQCNNIGGSYFCTCPKGSHGNGTKANPCTPDSNSPRSSWSMGVRITIGVGAGIIVLLVVAFLLYLQHEQKRHTRMRRSFFRQNGGHLLIEKLTRRDLSINMVTIFSVEELEKATNNYNENNIIGRGGYGMVYKGIIVSPNRQVVAIKRSLKVDSNQIEQFVNEVLILSQLNHKNVVKLLGCCLETEVPLLVYEYIENGTLYDHLHNERRVSLLTNWEVRLKIAVEIAEVLTYLHFTISTPIIHRDIKSMNILLDDNYTAKVSDFGTSRLVPTNQDQNATMIQGTYGYLDPEYMQIGQLNEKSDVYSFGVVLLELLTREKAISNVRPENERCLAIYFLRKLKEDRLLEILDDKMIMNDGTIQQVKQVANIAKRCLKLKGEDRPSMKEIARALDEIRGNDTHPWCNNTGLVQEETEYLLNETLTYNEEFGTNTKDSSSSQNTHLQLVPLDGGR